VTPRSPDEELLQFPCDYLLKAFGSSAEDASFRERVLAAVNSVTPVGLDAVKERRSSAGRYLCVTVLVRFHNRQQLDATYRALSRIEGLLYLL